MDRIGEHFEPFSSTAVREGDGVFNQRPRMLQQCLPIGNFQKRPDVGKPEAISLGDYPLILNVSVATRTTSSAFA